MAPSGEDLPALQLLAGVPSAALASLAGVSLRTVRRWRTRRRAPPAVMLLLEILAGRIPWPGFEGWTCAGGRLYPPGARDGYSAAEIGHISLLRQLAREIGRRRSPRSGDRAPPLTRTTP
jgi:hypothetical protein